MKPKTAPKTGKTARKARGDQARAALRERGEAVKAAFEQQGITITQWAAEHGHPYQAVKRVLNGDSACTYGKGHEIAVALGMKPGAASAIAAE